MIRKHIKKENELVKNNKKFVFSELENIIKYMLSELKSFSKAI